MSITLVDSQTTGAASGVFNGHYYLAGQYPAGSSYGLAALNIPLVTVLSPTGNMWASIYTNGATIPDVLLGESSNSIDVSILIDGYTDYEFDFSPTIPIVGGTTYWIVLRGDTAWAGGTIGWRLLSVAGPVAKYSDNGVSWGLQYSNYRYDYKTYKLSGPAGIKTLNGIDIGSIKTINGVDLGSIKYINQVS